METNQPVPPPSRRRFLQGATAAATGVVGFPAIVSARSPNEKLDVAVIGCGGRVVKPFKKSFNLLFYSGMLLILCQGIPAE
jgi:hypothetical protein